jgi:hypothetical protein
MTTAAGGRGLRSISRLVVAISCVAGFACVAIPPTAAGALALRPPVSTVSSRSGKLSPRLLTLASRQSFASAHVEAAALSLPASGPGSLLWKPDGRVLVDIRASSTSTAAVASLRARGARIVDVSADYSTITAAVAPSALNAVADDSKVIYVSEVLAPLVGATGTSGTSGTFTPAASGCHPTISEGDTLMRVAAARAAQHVNGAGQTIGALSDSFNVDTLAPTHAPADVASGDLPGPANPCGYKTPVKVQAESTTGGEDEGRAMLELAHGLAPGARLAFATADNGDLDFARQITRLRTVNHATVLVDDVSYFDEPFFQDGPIAQAANAASSAGVPYFSAAGNSNVIVDGNNVGSYEAPAFRSTSCPASVTAFEDVPGAAVTGCHDFDPSAGVDNGDAVTVTAGGGFDIDLQWAQPWGGVTTDYDLFVLNAAGSVVASSAFDQAASQEPFEFLGYGNQTGAAQTYRIVIAQVGSGPPARLKFVFAGSAGITAVQYNTSTGGDIIGPTIFGHNGAASVGSTGAIPYDNANAPETYSSRGPVTLYFKPTPSKTPLPTPSVLSKPDFAATDNVRNVFFIEPSAGGFRFPGTSAAAPQAAAIGALLRQDDPGMPPAQIMATLRATAQPVATNGTPADVGGGYLDANAALASVVPLPGAPRVVSNSNGNARTTLQWSKALAGPKYPVIGYRVTPIRGGVPQPTRTFEGSAARHVIGGLTNGARYAFVVTAFNANGFGPASVQSKTIVIGAPGAPTGVTAHAGHQTATIRWTAPATNGKPIVAYIVTPYLGTVAKPSHVFKSNATNQTMHGLSVGKMYAFRVAARNGRGTGASSAASKPVKVA